MQVFFRAAVLFLVLFSARSVASDPPVLIDQDQPAPFDGVLITAEDMGALVAEITALRQIVSMRGEAIDACMEDARVAPAEIPRIELEPRVEVRETILWEWVAGAGAGGFVLGVIFLWLVTM